MFWTNNSDYNNGYTRGGIDVITGVNLFFKFLLLSPIFLLAGIVFVTMFKHVIYHGVPTMSVPTEEQREQLRQKNEAIEVLPAPKPEVQAVQPAPVVMPTQPSPEVVSAVQARIDQDWEAARLRQYCVTSWLPKYGNNPNAIKAGSPCFQYQ